MQRCDAKGKGRTGLCAVDSKGKPVGSMDLAGTEQCGAGSVFVADAFVVPEADPTASTLAAKKGSETRQNKPETETEQEKDRKQGVSWLHGTRRSNVAVLHAAQEAGEEWGKAAVLFHAVYSLATRELTTQTFRIVRGGARLTLKGEPSSSPAPATGRGTKVLPQGHFT